MPPTCGNLEIIEIGPDENDSCSRFRGFDADANRYPMVQPHARCRYRPLDRGLKPQGLSPPYFRIYYNTAPGEDKRFSPKDLF